MYVRLSTITLSYCQCHMSSRLLQKIVVLNMPLIGSYCILSAMCIPRYTLCIQQLLFYSTILYECVTRKLFLFCHIYYNDSEYGHRITFVIQFSSYPIISYPDITLCNYPITYIQYVALMEQICGIHYQPNYFNISHIIQHFTSCTYGRHHQIHWLH